MIDRKNVIIKYGDDGSYVGGFSYKLQKIWFTKKHESVKRFTIVSANRFITDHVGKGSFEAEFITLVFRNPGEKFFGNVEK